MTTTGDDLEATDTGFEAALEEGPITLESSLVRYDGKPDRRTIYPPGLSSVARMSTWLTADSDAFIDLGEVR